MSPIDEWNRHTAANTAPDGSYIDHHAQPGEALGGTIEYPRRYWHRRGCSRRHPIPFPCDGGTVTPEAVAYLHANHLPCLCDECLTYLASDGIRR